MALTMNIKKEVMRFLVCMGSTLVIILFHDNARPNVARMTLQKVTKLGYETLIHPPYSPYLSPTVYHFLNVWNFFTSENISFKKRCRKSIKRFFLRQNLKSFIIQEEITVLIDDRNA